MKKFTSIQYNGGLLNFPKPEKLDISILTESKVLLFENLSQSQKLPFDSIVDVNFDEKKDRSTGKAVLGAVVGGALTGGLGLIAGAALGGRKKNDSNLYIEYKTNERIISIILKPKGKSEEIYAAITSALLNPTVESIVKDEIVDNRTPEQIKKDRNSAIGCLIVFALLIILLLQYC